eukprot:scaffold111050_cov43-Tisochrysis_lutea.AAC.1
MEGEPILVAYCIVELMVVHSSAGPPCGRGLAVRRDVPHPVHVYENWSTFCERKSQREDFRHSVDTSQ